MKPSRKEVEEAIEAAQLWTEFREDTDGISFSVKRLRALTTAARWALELVDDDNPPLLPEELKRLGAAMRAERAKPRAKK